MVPRPPSSTYYSQRFQHNRNGNLRPGLIGPRPFGPRMSMPLAIPRRPLSPWDMVPSWSSPRISSPVLSNPEYFQRTPQNQNLGPWFPLPAPQSQSPPGVFLFSQPDYQVPIPQLQLPVQSPTFPDDQSFLHHSQTPYLGFQNQNPFDISSFPLISPTPPVGTNTIASNGSRNCNQNQDPGFYMNQGPPAQFPQHLEPYPPASNLPQSRDFMPEAQQQAQRRNSNSSNARTQTSVQIPRVKSKKSRFNAKKIKEYAKRIGKSLVPCINSSAQVSPRVLRPLPPWVQAQTNPFHFQYTPDPRMDQNIIPLGWAPPLLYHYTNRAGVDGILRDGYLKLSKQDSHIIDLNETSPNARHGHGIYFTDINPELPTFDILLNNYGKTERFRDRAEYCFEFESEKIPNLQGPFVLDNYGNPNLKERLIWICKCRKFFLDKRETELNIGTYYQRLDETGENSDKKVPEQVILLNWKFKFNPSEGEE